MFLKDSVLRKSQDPVLLRENVLITRQWYCTCLHGFGGSWACAMSRIRMLLRGPEAFMSVGWGPACIIRTCAWWVMPSWVSALTVCERTLYTLRPQNPACMCVHEHVCAALSPSVPSWTFPYKLLHDFTSFLKEVFVSIYLFCFYYLLGCARS